MVLQWVHLNQVLLLLLFSDLIVSNFLRPHGLQHASSSVLHHLSEFAQSLLRVCPLSWWCHLTISSIAHPPFSSCRQSFPASGSFPVSQLFASGGQSIGASATVLPKNIQGWFLYGILFKSKKKKELLIQITTWRSLKQIRLSVKSQFQKNTYFWSIHETTYIIFVKWHDYTYGNIEIIGC